MPGYQTKQESIAVTGVADLVIRSLLDKQQYSDPLGEAERMGISSAMWPLFGLLWPSGAHLAARMALRPVDPTERVLEIGCGLGLASLVGHRRGADVTASDCHPMAAAFLAENVRLNGLAPMKYRHGHWSAAEHEQDAPAGAGPSPTGVHGHFDLIIGSDLLYERDANANLAHFIGPPCQPHGRDLDHRSRPRQPAAFNRQMAEQGFAMREEKLDRVAAPGIDAYKGRLLVYRWAAPMPPAPLLEAAPLAAIATIITTALH